MQITDPIADMLTRIRNAGTAKHETVDVPASKMKKSIAEILLNEGYIKSYQVLDDGTQGVIRITLKYLPGKEKAIQGLRRVSKPGLRVYAGADELPRVLKGLGIAIISTSKGVMTDKEARKQHVGGEVLTRKLASSMSAAKSLRSYGKEVAECPELVEHPLPYRPVLKSRLTSTTTSRSRDRKAPSSATSFPR